VYLGAKKVGEEADSLLSLMLTTAILIQDENFCFISVHFNVVLLFSTHLNGRNSLQQLVS
jgi:hypothetical protein